MVDRNIINHVIQEYRSSNAPIVTAAFHGKRGHPILFDANLMKELKNIEEDTQGLRSVVSRHESKVRGVETSEAALVDIDRLSDLQLLDASSENLGQT
jgi:molybdenum cofactor cytidylyltransferase